MVVKLERIHAELDSLRELIRQLVAGEEDE